LQFLQGEEINIASPTFAEALQQTSKGNYVLVEGGHVMNEVPRQDRVKLLDYLYELLIKEPKQKHQSDAILEMKISDLMIETELKRNPYFKENLKAPHVKETFVFNYGIKNGSISRIYQRIPNVKQLALRRTVHDTAWMFEKVLNAGIVKKEQTAALVMVPTNQQEQQMSDFLGVLNSVTRVLDLNDHLHRKKSKRGFIPTCFL
jgi:hypothetical protein